MKLGNKIISKKRKQDPVKEIPIKKHENYLEKLKQENK